MQRAFTHPTGPRIYWHWLIELFLCVAIILLLVYIVNTAGVPPSPAKNPTAIESNTQDQNHALPGAYITAKKGMAAQGFHFSDTPPAVRPQAEINHSGSLVKTTPVNFVILCDPLVKQGENHYLQTCTMKAGE